VRREKDKGVVHAATLAVALLAAGRYAAAADAAFPTGQVIERVPCLADARQTYALYLPSSYRGGRPWPILYAFDPGARGQIPVRLFSRAAERLGFIVAASNNSRNGPLPPILAAMEAVWLDTHQRLAVDAVRVYATGMSGGTLPARLLALDQGLGLIACAGALDASQLPTTGRRLDWLGIAGDADFNYSLTRSVVLAMVERGAVARFASFEGGHGWPPESLASRALDWLELGAMRAGHRARDGALIDALYEQGLVRARELLAAGRWDDAAEENAALAREFAGLKPVEALAAEARRLRDTREAKKDRKRETKLAERDRSATTELVALRTAIERAFDSNSSEALRSVDAWAERPVVADLWTLQRELDGRIAGFTHDLESNEADKRILAKRVLDGFYIATFFAGGERRDARRFEAALADFDTCARMRPGTASPLYEKARTYAARGDRKRALAALKNAVALGFKDATRLAEDPEWAELRGSPEYLSLSDGLRSTP
jgi:poly(3-hydroxybutyrate) depolymerase